MMYFGFGGPGENSGAGRRRRMDLESIGRILLFVGVGIAALGGLLLIASRIPGLNRLGNLPGDVRIQTGNVSCLVPIVSMIIISVVLTIIVNVILRLFNK
jgi:hypothetical protein